MREPAQNGKDTKVAQLYALLREEARALGPHGRLPSVRDLCQNFGTSRTTLDQVLDDLEAHDIIYRKHGRGLFVSPKLFRTTIGIIINATWLANRARLSPIWGLLWGLFAQEAELRSRTKNEYYCLHTILPSPDIPLSEEIIHLVKTGRMRGVLNIGVPYEAVEWLTDQNIPCVSFFIYGPWRVNLNVTEMLRMAIEYLVQNGCRHIGLWATDPYTGPIPAPGSFTYEGDAFRYFLAEQGLEYNPELVRPLLPDNYDGATRSLTSQQQGYLLAQEVFGRPESPKPDGLVILDDMITDGALASFFAQGVRLGEDLKIVTHANAGMMAFFDYIQGIRVLEFDPQDAVRTMFKILDDLLSGQSVPEQEVSIAPRWRRSQ